MKIKDVVQMKHMSSRADDLMIDFEADLLQRVVTLNFEWIDTGLIEWFLQVSVLHLINTEMKKAGHAEFENLSSFQIELVVDGEAKFKVEQHTAAFDKTTLVMKLRK